MPKTSTQNQSLDASTLKDISSKLDTLIERLAPVPSTTELPPTGVGSGPDVVVPANPYPVPTDFREVVSTVLNKHFGLEITPLADRPAFQLDIIVPDKYTNISPEHKKMYGADRRVRIISYAEGTTGVRAYAERVLESFNQDMKSLIAVDRAIP